MSSSSSSSGGSTATTIPVEEAFPAGATALPGLGNPFAGDLTLQALLDQVIKCIMFCLFIWVVDWSFYAFTDRPVALKKTCTRRGYPSLIYQPFLEKLYNP